jgi:hypothetical protein
MPVRHPGPRTPSSGWRLFTESPNEFELGSHERPAAIMEVDPGPVSWLLEPLKTTLILKAWKWAPMNLRAFRYQARAFS